MEVEQYKCYHNGIHPTTKSRGLSAYVDRNKRVHSMIYEQTGFKIKDDILSLSKIGDIPIVVSRPIIGIIKQIIVKFLFDQNLEDRNIQILLVMI